VDYIKCLEDLLEKYQRTEEDCIESIKDIFLKALDIEKVLGKTKEDKLIEQVEIVKKIEASKEIEEIIRKLNPQSKKVEEIRYVKVICNSESILQKFDNHYSRGKDPEEFDFESIRAAVISGIEIGMDKETQELRNTLQKMLCACWENEPNFSPAELQQFNEIIKTELARKVFCECLNTFRKKGLFSLSNKAYAAVGKLLYDFTEHMIKNSDYKNIMPIIILSATFYTVQATDNEKNISKIYLQESLSRHPCFKDEKFWVTLIDNPLNEGIQEPPKDETPEEKNFREMNEIFSRLGTYAHNMLHFRLEKKLVEKIIFRCADEKGLSESYRVAIQQQINVTASTVLTDPPPNESLMNWLYEAKPLIEVILC